MRILHAVRSDGYAGVERHVATLAAAQANAGHEVVVVGGDPERMTAELSPRGVRTIAARSTADVLAAVRRDGADAEIVHAHMTAAEVAASASARSPLVVTRHFARARGATPAGRLAGVLVRRRMQAQIAISRYVAQAVDGEATVIYPGVPVVDVAPGPRRPAVLVVQRLQPEKRTDIAVRAFAAADPEGWTLDIIGRGPEESALRALARRLGVADRVRFLGFRDDVSEQMSAAGVLLAPCDVEGLGLSVLEAMAHALPVVASRAGAHGETVGSVGGARLHDPEDWEMAGRLLAELVADAGEREAYGARLADAQRARFTPEAQVSATDAVYRKVVG